MAQKITRKSLKHDEFVDAAFDIGDWLQKNWRQVAMGAGGLVAVLLIGLAWLSWSARGQKAAARDFGEGMRFVGALEEPSSPTAPGTERDYAKALAAFEKAAKEGGGSTIGRIAEMYRGVALLRLGRAAEAATVLEGVVRAAKDPVVTNSARALLAQAYEAAKDDEKAIAVLRELSQQTNGGYPADVALLELGKVLQRAGKAEEARQTWQDLLTRYPQGSEAGEARTLLEGAKPTP